MCALVVDGALSGTPKEMQGEKQDDEQQEERDMEKFPANEASMPWSERLASDDPAPVRPNMRFWQTGRCQSATSGVRRRAIITKRRAK